MPNIKSRNWFVRHKILSIVSVAIVVIVIIIVATSSNNKNLNSNEADSKTNSSAQNGSKTTSKGTAAPAQRKVTGTATQLGAGTFVGGKDVAIGLYDVTPGAGESGNFIVTGTDNYDEILGGDSSLEGVPKVRAQISSGDKIEISGLSSVTFTPVTAPFVTAHTTTNLYAGTFVVGQDIGAGRYVATPGAGESGNFIVNGADSYDEILGGDSSLGGVPSVTVTLTNGDVINISGLSQVVMTAQ